MIRQLSCPVCYTAFETECNSKKFCSAKCRRKAGYQGKYKANTKTERITINKNAELWQTPTRRKTKNNTAIDNLAALARAEGLSYGQYVAKYNL